MASALADAHIEGQRRLRVLTAGAVARIWDELPGYDRQNVDEWLSRVLPVITTAQRGSVALTEAFIARYLERQPLGVNPGQLIGAGARNGAEPAEVYERPFVTLWSALGAGTPFEDAASKALARATSTAAMDVQLAMRGTASAVQGADAGIFGYQRVADPGACEFCSLVDGAYLKSADAMPLHNHCGCGVEPLTAPHPRAAKLPSGVSVHQHGELGPVLADPAHDFTTTGDIPAL